MDNPCKHCNVSNPDCVNDHEYGCDNPCEKAVDFREVIFISLEQISKDLNNLIEALKEIDNDKG